MSPLGPLTPAKMRQLADELTQDEPTSFTSDEAYAALSRLAAAATTKLDAAGLIRGGRPAGRRVRRIRI